MEFAQLGLPEYLLSTIEKIGYKTPTPIQEKAVPVALQGRDVIGAAQTGTGKTAAYALPTLARLGEPKGKPRCLVLVPTRELAMQVDEAFRRFGENTADKIALLYGGVRYDQQVKALRAGAEIVVATPGRLLDLQRQRFLDLSSIEVLVLDEVDRMLDMGFIEDVSAIIRLCPKDRQTLLFSATVNKTIREIAGWALREPVEIDVRTGTLAADTISHALYPVAGYQKYDLLLALLERTKYRSVIVFTRTKRDADRITEWLEANGIAVATMHADRTQRERVEALGGFKSGKYSVLVATDIASRGLDISGVSHVINYNVPEHPEDYVHRIGRTGRAGDEGEAFTLFSPDELSQLQAIERLLGKPIERKKLDGFRYRTEPLMLMPGAVPAARPRRRNR
ncbi:MAG TPA: DEAD/DEAH box helicase [Candidatus Spyradosoma merdigallinarum]|uniref:DEAD-box ATP-dependent RNA helicase RhpA n=1 Tax=Candidatus Spyradosoma merdigallinarum TaxID=2840950 RepID=A0A9D1NJX8_9BACT|nr:DEAD/DEAH box helicase [Candidatus Spyradosoma merdigallinarum]